jgi:hypothetical protein
LWEDTMSATTPCNIDQPVDRDRYDRNWDAIDWDDDYDESEEHR